jgi:outer membrane protein assembly factor BamD (BamD/ComL family)
MQRAHGRLTKKDLKEDELVTRVLQAWGYIEKNYPKFLAGLGAIVVAVLAGMFIKSQSDQQTQASIDALGDVRIALHQGKVEDAVFQAERVAEEYSGKPAAEQVLLLLGGLYYDLGRYAEAQTTYQGYLSTYGDEGPAGYAAWIGIAACLEEQGSYVEAAEKYVAYADQYRASPFAPIVLKEASRCYAGAGNPEKAQGALQRILKDYPKSSIVRSAKAELRQMGVMN